MLVSAAAIYGVGASFGFDYVRMDGRFTELPRPSRGRRRPRENLPPSTGAAG
jgi:hypothetical protein